MARAARRMAPPRGLMQARAAAVLVPVAGVPAVPVARVLAVPAPVEWRQRPDSIAPTMLCHARPRANSPATFSRPDSARRSSG